jgi:hypothetical protein
MSLEHSDGGTGNTGDAGTTPGALPGWMASLPDAHKSNARFAQFKEPAQVWDKFDKLLQADGKMTVIPDDNATDEERAAFYAKLGRPETPDKYDFAKPDDFPDAILYSKDSETAFKAIAHEVGMTKKQAKKTYDWYCGLAKMGWEKTQQEQAQATEKAIAKLKDELPGDAFEQTKTAAVKGFKMFAKDVPDMYQLIESVKAEGVALGDHPAFIKFFAKISDAISDDSLSAGGRSGGRSGEMSDEDRARSRFPNTYPKK